MSVIKFLRDITGLFNWSTDENPTSQQDYQNAVKNWVATETSIVDALLWQPETVYAVGNQVKTPSLPSESVLVCTVSGTSGASEPDYTNVSVGDTVTDGTVEWEVSAVFTSNGGTMTRNLNLTNYAQVDVGADMHSDGMGGVIGVTGNGMRISAEAGGVSYAGAFIDLNGRTGQDGRFIVSANNASGSASLVGTPAGNLRWNDVSMPSGYLDTVSSNTAKTMTLPVDGMYLVITGHNSTPALNGIFIVRTGGNSAFKLAGGANVTMTCSGRNITVTPSGGSVSVSYIFIKTN